MYKYLFILTLFSTLLFSGCAEKSLTFQVRFPEVRGLTQNDHVYFGRNDIGEVQKVSYTSQGDYLVDIRIAQEFKNAATEDSRFYIEHAPANESAMAVIVEQERPGGVLLQDGAVVQGSAGPRFLDNIFNSLNEKAKRAESELNTTLKNLKKSGNATSEKLSQNLEATLDELSRRLDSFTEELGKVPDSQQVHQLEESFRKFADEFQKSQKDVQEYIRNEILPRFRLELEHLRKQQKNEKQKKELEKLDQQARELETV